MLGAQAIGVEDLKTEVGTKSSVSLRLWRGGPVPHLWRHFLVGIGNRGAVLVDDCAGDGACWQGSRIAESGLPPSVVRGEVFCVSAGKKTTCFAHTI